MGMRFNVAYDAHDGVRHYLTFDVDKATAEAYCKKFADKYVGKPYPNGKGFYPFKNPRVVCVVLS